MAQDLRFSAPLNAAPPFDLRFGNDAAPVAATSNVALNTTAPAPTLTAIVQRLPTVLLTAIVPAPTLLSSLQYDNAVYRGVANKTEADWQVAKHLQASSTSVLQDSARLKVSNTQLWKTALRLSAPSTFAMQDARRIVLSRSSSWQLTKPVGASVASVFADLLKMRHERTAKWQIAVPVTTSTETSWQERLRTARPATTSAWQVAQPVSTTLTSYEGVGKTLTVSRLSSWGEASKPLPGKHSHVITPVITPCYNPPVGNLVDLRFTDPFSISSDLRFKCVGHTTPPTQTIVIPIQRTYIVQNDIHLTTVVGNHELPLISISLQIDRDSWTWGFNATVDKSAQSLLMTGTVQSPIELDALINGKHYRLLAEGVRRNREFGKTTLTISGRGRSALLSAPYAPTLSFANTTDRTAQQLMEDVLTVNGVSLGWSLDWRIDDWLVPAGVWSHQGTYMSAVTAIAKAAGAFIQPDPVTQTLRVRARYSAAPWEWTGVTPDIVLPADVVVTEGVEWFEKPAYNVVYVSGTKTGGILGQVKRAGTAGDYPAPMVTEALITDVIAARQLGISILSNTGLGAMYSLSLPILPLTGIIEPDTFIHYTEGAATVLGIVDRVSTTSTQGSSRQTIEVETYA